MSIDAQDIIRFFALLGAFAAGCVVGTKAAELRWWVKCRRDAKRMKR